ncbi:MAG: response regulator [Patescibacteria group bacterium]
MAAKSVLLVEDNEELRRLYREIFHHNNFEIFEAADGETAVAEALANKPSIIVLDLMLPRQGGIGALRVLKSNPLCSNIPVIILTAMPNQEYREMTKGMVEGYFLKTEITPQKLVSYVIEKLKN